MSTQLAEVVGGFLGLLVAVLIFTMLFVWILDEGHEDFAAPLALIYAVIPKGKT